MKKLFLSMAVAFCSLFVNAQGGQTFRVVTYNVDGLPAASDRLNLPIVNANSPGESGTQEMARRLADLTPQPDIIAVQEDFDYNESLVDVLGSNNYQGEYWQGGFNWGEISGLKLQVDGLNVFWNKGTTNVDRGTSIVWKQTYGGLINGIFTGGDSGFDNYVAKGYRYYRAKVKDEKGGDAYIDIFTLHMDAGSTTGDINAKNAQLTQLADAVIAIGQNRPKIILGDFNSRYTRENIKELFIDRINNSGKFTIEDAWVENMRNGVYPAYQSPTVNEEIVDKIFYVNPSLPNTIRLELDKYEVKENFTEGVLSENNGQQIGDHDPVIADFLIKGSLTVDLDKYPWAWKGEAVADKEFYILNYQSNSFLHLASKLLVGIPEEKDVVYLEPHGNQNARTYALRNSNKKYITWGAIEAPSWIPNWVPIPSFPLEVDQDEVWKIEIGNWITLGAAYNTFTENYTFTDNKRDVDDLYYIIWYDGSLGDSFLEVTSTNENTELTKNSSGDLNSKMTAENKQYNWKLISKEQMEVYKQYLAALRSALDYVNNYEPANPDIESLLMAELTNTTTRYWSDPKVTAFIELVNSIKTANLTISPKAKDKNNPNPWGTFIAPFEVYVPVGVYAFEVTADPSTESLVFGERYSGKIPAGTAVLVMKPNGQDKKEYYGQCPDTICKATFTHTDAKLVITDQTNKNHRTGDLIGSYVKQKLPKATGNLSHYLLQVQEENGEDMLAFYWCNPDPEKDYTIGKNRCWLVKEGEAPGSGTINPVKAFFFHKEDNPNVSTDIDENVINDSAKVIYDLSGRKVLNPQHGIYIVNGKKMLIK